MRFHRGISLAHESTWRIGMERLVGLGCFGENEISSYVPSKPAEKQPEHRQVELSKPSLDELEHLNLSTDEGAARGRQIANEHYYSVEAAAVYQRWQTWLYETFGGYVLTPEAKKAAIQFFVDCSLSCLDVKAWSRARLFLIRRGLMPLTCRLPEEVLAEEVEQTTERLDTFSARQNLNRKLSQFGQKLLQ